MEVRQKVLVVTVLEVEVTRGRNGDKKKSDIRGTGGGCEGIEVPVWSVEEVPGRAWHLEYWQGQVAVAGDELLNLNWICLLLSWFSGNGSAMP